VPQSILLCPHLIPYRLTLHYLVPYVCTSQHRPLLRLSSPARPLSLFFPHLYANPVLSIFISLPYSSSSSSLREQIAQSGAQCASAPNAPTPGSASGENWGRGYVSRSRCVPLSFSLSLPLFFHESIVAVLQWLIRSSFLVDRWPTNFHNRVGKSRMSRWHNPNLYT
jgi:hypothetical protein